MSTLVIDGSEVSKAVTTSFIPLFLEIIRKGRRALNALRAFSDLRDSLSVGESMSSRDAQTTKRSSMFQGSTMYGFN